ncbi:MAG TPA: hypothetical protein VMV94_12035, partial [Phycisphaerae bacterium]|nr:hypothetical protein [Phycisphaerae bacterium]
VLKRRWVPRDWSKRRCVLLSIPVFVLAFVFVPYGLEWLSEMAFGSGQVQHLSQRLSVSENAVLGILILIWLVITYAIGRLAYMGLRWRRAVVQAVVDSGAPACPACFYNMSGNTTGVCPECGAVVPALRMDAESQAAN